MSSALFGDLSTTLTVPGTASATSATNGEFELYFSHSVGASSTATISFSTSDGAFTPESASIFGVWIDSTSAGSDLVTVTVTDGKVVITNTSTSDVGVGVLVSGSVTKIGSDDSGYSGVTLKFGGWYYTDESSQVKYIMAGDVVPDEAFDAAGHADLHALFVYPDLVIPVAKSGTSGDATVTVYFNGDGSASMKESLTVVHGSGGSTNYGTQVGSTGFAFLAGSLYVSDTIVFFAKGADSSNALSPSPAYARTYELSASGTSDRVVFAGNAPMGTLTIKSDSDNIKLGQVTMTGDLIVDNVKFVGSGTGDVADVYACGHNLVVSYTNAGGTINLYGGAPRVTP